VEALWTRALAAPTAPQSGGAEVSRTGARAGAPSITMGGCAARRFGRSSVGAAAVDVRGYVDTAEGQVHYRETGSGDAVVLLHQSPSSSAMWEPLLPRLADAGFRAVAFDLPGFGMSDPPPEQPTLSYYARRIVDAAAGLGLERYNLIGHHTGCAVAVAIAAEYPDRVRRIVGYGVPLLAAESARELADEAPPEYDEAGEVVLAKWHHYWSVAPSGLQATLAARTVSEMLSAGRLLPYAHRAVGRADNAALMRGVSVPMLALAGTRELLRRETEAAASLSPWVRFVELGDATTFAADERPHELAALITEFLRADDAAA
jgi:pimeloyl-ACP methyl ester carboxylesterase